MSKGGIYDGPDGPLHGDGTAVEDATELLDQGCISCDEDCEPDDPNDYDGYRCPKAKRPCGHHCNHIWSHEECCWCGLVIGEGHDA